MRAQGAASLLRDGRAPVRVKPTDHNARSMPSHHEAATRPTGDVAHPHSIRETTMSPRSENNDAGEKPTWFSGFGNITTPSALSSRARAGTRRARVLIAFVYAAMLAMNAWWIYGAYGNELRAVELGNTNLARAVTDRMDSTFSETDHILGALVYELERSQIDTELFEHLQPMLVNHVATSSKLKDLSLIGKDGTWLLSSFAGWSSAFRSADQAYFLHHQENPSSHTRVGTPIRSQASGEWVIPVSRRFNDADGNFAGVVLATLSIHDLRAMLERFEIADGSITLTVAEHYLIRRPPIETETGQPIHPAWRAAFQGRREGTGQIVSPIDGVQRLFSFEHARNYPVRVVVAASKAQALRDWWIWSTLQTVWFVFLCYVLHRAVIYFRRTILYKTQAEARLREARDALAVANEKLAHMAQYDALTGLPNRRYFDRRLARAFRQAQREQRPFAVILVDVDEFKKYNDLHGHPAGDECLRRVASALRATIKRPEDFAARYGGEEMAILLPGTDVDGARLFAETVRVGVSSLDMAHTASRFGTVTISLGVAAWVPQAAELPDAMVKAADDALYQAKRDGRNTVRVHAPDRPP